MGKRNGIELGQVVHEDETVSAFGEDCGRYPKRTSFSGGATVGLVIACVFVIGAAIFGFLWYNKRQTPSAEENHLADDLLYHIVWLAADRLKKGKQKKSIIDVKLARVITY